MPDLLAEINGIKPKVLLADGEDRNVVNDEVGRMGKDAKC